MEQIKSAEEFLEQEEFYAVTSGDEYEIQQAMIKFAKYHTKLALEAAAKKSQLTDFACEFLQEGVENAIDKDSILNSYNLDNIK